MVCRLGNYYRMNKKILYSVLFLVLLAGSAWFLFTRDTAPVPKAERVESEVVVTDTLKIIAFGDSLTAGYGVLQSEAYPAQLETALTKAGYLVSVINAGVSGETTRGNLERANFIQSQNPDIVIVGIGGNDALRSLPIEETEKNIRATIDILQSSVVPPQILLLKMQAPLNAGTAYKQQFDSLFETLALEKGLTLVPFITEDIFLDKANKISDGIHYNQLGYQKVVEQHIFPAVLKLLEKREDIDRFKAL